MNIAHPLARPVLCLADTKLVLGNVCVATVFNGRSIGDFATLLAMASSAFGATRSLYRWLERDEVSYDWLERGRGADEIAAMDMLDAPPASWVDLMTTLGLAEAATSAVARSLAQRAEPTLANQLKKLERDSAFHIAYVVGWLKVSCEQGPQALRASVRTRFPLALRWLQGCESRAVDAFLQACQPLAELVAEPWPDAAPRSGEWDAERARAGVLPQRLFELVRFKDAELVA